MSGGTVSVLTGGAGSSNMALETCGNCRFAEHRRNTPKEFLWCRRNPPMVFMIAQTVERPALLEAGRINPANVGKTRVEVMHSPVSEYPPTRADHWCGCWETKT